MPYTREQMEADYRKQVGDDFEAACKALQKLNYVYESCWDDMNDPDNYDPAYGTLEAISKLMVKLAKKNAFALERAKAILAKDDEDGEETSGGLVLREGGL